MMTTTVLFLALLGLPGSATPAAAPGWAPHCARDEICPRFRRQPNGGHDGGELLVIEAPDREGMTGSWRKVVAVQGGRHYRFRAFHREAHVAMPRQNVFANVTWQGRDGALATNDRKVVPGYLEARAWSVPPEFPADTGRDGKGWVEVSGTYRAPASATSAVIDLHLRWAAGARVEWSEVSLDEVPAPAPARTVRLAAVHLRPQAGNAEGNREAFVPLIAEAAAAKADLVVLPETLTYYGKRQKKIDIAEPVPGPSTAFFGALAAKHGLYIVAGLYERAGHLIHNVAVLLGPDGKLVGKYRKVSLPENEADDGVTPGNDYPVFQTRFGKVGMMICYDGFFPEVARELARRGAEVIAWPVWGAHPGLAAARAVENHVYLVSSTYEPPESNWIISGVIAPSGETLARAKRWGEVVVTEVDLAAPTQWNALGDFGAALPRHRPPVAGEPIATATK